MADQVCNALIIRYIEGKPSLVESPVHIPTPSSNQALIKVSYVAQNYTDVRLYESGESEEGCILGCDFVGKVEAIGSSVSKLQPGDIVSGLICGGQLIGLGAYSEYTVADEELCFKVPPNITDEEAVTVPLASCTAYLGLFSCFCLSLNQRQGPDVTVLIWGGSSSIGRFAIQIAAIYRFRVIATCGRTNFDTLRSLGAHYVLNYHDKDVIAHIRNIAPNLEYAFDAVGSSSSLATVSEALGKNGGNICTIRPNTIHALTLPPQVKATEVRLARAFLQMHMFEGMPSSPSLNDHHLASNLFKILPNWLQDGIIRPDNPRILVGGLGAVQEGFNRDYSGRPLGYKIIYQV
ncbi:chaperonin 10-like protein [Aspergillus carlsbadensis]|nr:chaperonin 10-like protein [Aspergillus carlsbadensis]